VHRRTKTPIPCKDAKNFAELADNFLLSQKSSGVKSSFLSRAFGISRDIREDQIEDGYELISDPMPTHLAIKGNVIRKKNLHDHRSRRYHSLLQVPNTVDNTLSPGSDLLPPFNSDSFIPTSCNAGSGIPKPSPLRNTWVPSEMVDVTLGAYGESCSTNRIWKRNLCRIGAGSLCKIVLLISFVLLLALSIVWYFRAVSVYEARKDRWYETFDCGHNNTAPTCKAHIVQAGMGPLVPWRHSEASKTVVAVWLSAHCGWSKKRQVWVCDPDKWNPGWKKADLGTIPADMWVERCTADDVEEYPVGCVDIDDNLDM